MTSRLPILSLITAMTLAACSPTVKLQAPDEPIRFDVNVNVTQEVRVKIDRELEEAFEENPELFGIVTGGAGNNTTSLTLEEDKE